MRKHRRQRKPSASVPMLVNRLINDNIETMQENAAITAFQFGVATVKHFDQISLMCNMIKISHQLKPSDQAQALGNTLQTIAESIKTRHDRTNKLGVSGEELKDLRNAVNQYDQYWKLQTTNHYNHCAAEVNAFYDEVKGSKQNG